tara:strand:- start:316 stop:870 length:555 start_codon:yes stop_codon:yes gene_type:complete
MPSRASIDSRVKNGNRILSLLHMITFLSGALSSFNEEKNMITISSLSLIGSQIMLQFILMILSEFYVQYDSQLSNKEKFKEDIKNLIKQSDIQHKKNNDLYLEIGILRYQLSEKAEKIQKLETQFRDIKHTNILLYARLERISKNEKEKKNILTELFNKIEENKTLVSEGDYITMCNLLKNLYE